MLTEPVEPEKYYYSADEADDAYIASHCGIGLSCGSPCTRPNCNGIKTKKVYSTKYLKLRINF